MKAIVIRAYGGPEVMKLDDVELPAPGAGEALVDVAISGVNFMDCREAQDGQIGASLRCETAPTPLTRRDFSTGICGLTGSL
jgi:NADPH:quinone reductase-like Zn-dependent oxidoreductase